MTESTDVVIVGSRCAGSAAAITLARLGRSVIALDAKSFPSDTLSTHLFFPAHWAEVERLGARDRVMELEPPLHTKASLGTPEVELLGRFNPYEGIAVGSCVRRPGLDQALVDTARAAGAEIRERTRVTALVRDDAGRTVGVRYKDRDGEEGVIHARLVIGADGRHSTVARLVESQKHHCWENRRLMAYAYFRDPREESRHIARQWRVGDELVTVFPCDGGQSVVLLMPPKARSEEFREDGDAAFDKTVAAIAPLAERLRGCPRESKIRVSHNHPAYFRHSQGPGWALAGDAGHFKDPVVAQGIRDALRFGRLLGEAAAPALDDPAALDQALAAWEVDRDTQCLPTYQWGNALGLADDVSPIESTAYRWFAARPDGPSELLDVFSRRRRPDEVFSPSRVARWVLRAARDPAVSRRALWDTLRRDVRREVARIAEQRRFERRRAASARRMIAALSTEPQQAEAASTADPVAA